MFAVMTALTRALIPYGQKFNFACFCGSASKLQSSQRYPTRMTPSLNGDTIRQCIFSPCWRVFNDRNKSDNRQCSRDRQRDPASNATQVTAAGQTLHVRTGENPRRSSAHGLTAREGLQAYHLLFARCCVSLRRQAEKTGDGRILDALLIRELLHCCPEVAAAVLIHLFEEQRELCSAVRARFEFTEATQDRATCVVEKDGFSSGLIVFTK